MTDWEGTYLSAAFLAPPRVWSDLPNLLTMWQQSGLISSGRAQWLQLLPDQVSYERIMDGQEVFEVEWRNGEGHLSALSSRFSLSTIVFPFAWYHEVGQLMINIMVYPDSSVGVYLNAPYQSIYEDVPSDVGGRNIALFLDAACTIFAPDTFLVGCIQEEAQFSGINPLINGGQLPADWAFYGTAIGASLQSTGAFTAQPLEVRTFPGNGLFVRWTEWDEPPNSPVEWQESVARTVDLLSTIDPFPLGGC